MWEREHRVAALLNPASCPFISEDWWGGARAGGGLLVYKTGRIATPQSHLQLSQILVSPAQVKLPKSFY